MAPTQPNHPQSGSRGRIASGTVIKLVAAIGVLLFVIIILAAIAYLRFFRGNSDEATEEMPATVEPAVTYDLAGSPFPAYPGAVTPLPEQVGWFDPPAGEVSLSLVAANVPAATVFQWYQDNLASFGYSLEGVSSDVRKIEAQTPLTQGANIYFLDLPDGSTGVLAYIRSLPPTPEPPPAEPTLEAAAAEAPPATEVAAPEPPLPDAVQPATEEMPAQDLPGLSPDTLALSVSVSPASIYAGTLNQVTYTIVVTGSGRLTVTVTLPDGVLFHPDDLAALGFALPDPAHPEQAIWKPDLGNGGTASAKVDGINDLLHPPDSLVMKVIAESDSPDQQPVVQAAVLETEKY